MKPGWQLRAWLYTCAIGWLVGMAAWLVYRRAQDALRERRRQRDVSSS